MSHKLLYRTACFIFGFGIGVVYFAAPSSSHVRAEADDLPLRPKSEARPSSALQDSQPPEEELETLEEEEDKLIELEAELVGQLRARTGDSETLNGSEVAVEAPQEQAARQGQQPPQGISEQKDLESIARELSKETGDQKKSSEEPEEPDSAVAKLPAQQAGARAKMGPLPQIPPASISRKVYFFDDQGATIEEKILEIQVTTAFDPEGWVAMDFDTEDAALSMLQHGLPAVDSSKEAREISPGKVVPQEADATDSDPASRVAEEQLETDEPGGQPGVLAEQVTELKMQNLDLKEQVLSLRVMMQAMQDVPAVQKDVTEKSPAVDSAAPDISAPDVLQVRKKGRSLPDRPVVAAPHTRTMPVNTDSDFESQPGDPVLVRYDRTPLRTGPGTNYSRVTVLPRGTQLIVDYHREGWFRVYTPEGVRAWISQDAVQWF